jgi:hypothetical protein
MMSSCSSVAVWMNSTTAASRIARSPRYPESRHDSSSSAGRIRLPPPVADVAAHLGDQRDVGADLLLEEVLDLREVVLDQLHDLLEIGDAASGHWIGRGHAITGSS